MAILVTGGAGFIGSALVRRLVGAGRSVVNVDKLTYAGNLESLRGVLGEPGHIFECVDVAHAAAIRGLVALHQPEAVVHLAAESHVDRSIDEPGEFVRTNVLGTFTVLEEARQYWMRLPAARRARFRFVHVSTDEVFGSLGAEGYFDEATPHRPNSPYSASKAAADHLARAWYHTYDFPVITTNCSNNYGPYQFPEKLIPLTIVNALEGKPLRVYGRGANVRDWLYVEDHVDALLCVLARGRAGHVYPIGGRGERRNIDVVRAVCATLDDLAPRADGTPYERLITFVEDRPGHDLRYAVDARKTEHELGWRPAESFASGLRKTVQWYLDNRGWWERVRSGAYRGERLGLGAVRPSSAGRARDGASPPSVPAAR